MNTKVYILGAGASKPDGVPLMNEFISEGITQWDYQEDPDAIIEIFRFAKEAFLIGITFSSNASNIPDASMFETGN